MSIGPARRASPARTIVRAALVPAAALLVHELRFMLAFGGGAGSELARQGHSYLHSLVPWIVLLIGVAVGGFLWALEGKHDESAGVGREGEGPGHLGGRNSDITHEPSGRAVSIVSGVPADRSSPHPGLPRSPVSVGPSFSYRRGNVMDSNSVEQEVAP